MKALKQIINGTFDQASPHTKKIFRRTYESRGSCPCDQHSETIHESFRGATTRKNGKPHISWDLVAYWNGKISTCYSRPHHIVAWSSVRALPLRPLTEPVDRQYFSRVKQSSSGPLRSLGSVSCQISTETRLDLTSVSFLHSPPNSCPAN